MSVRTTILLAAAALCGCATSTKIQSSWTDPTFAGTPFDRIAVVALFDTPAESRTFEQTAARELEERGIGAVPAYSIVGVERNVYRDPAPYLRVPGALMFGDPYYWYYYPRWDYYWHWRSSWDVTHSPGYWEPLTYLIVESSLYDARRDRLVWTAKSATMDTTQFEALANSIADEVTDELVAMEVVAGNSRTAAVR
jgi:hypothetical protein